MSIIEDAIKDTFFEEHKRNLERYSSNSEYIECGDHYSHCETGIDEQDQAEAADDAMREVKYDIQKGLMELRQEEGIESGFSPEEELEDLILKIFVEAEEESEDPLLVTKNLVEECLYNFLSKRRVNNIEEICKKAKETIKNL